jgi:hypothetical protein
MKYVTTVKGSLIAGLLLFSSLSFGDETGNEAVKELLEVSGAKSQYEQLIIVMTSNMKEGFQRGFEMGVEGKSLDRETLVKGQAIFTKKFNQLVDDFTRYMQEEVSWDVMVNEVYAPVYQKYLTIDEIRDISSFYKSKSGAKFAEISPFLIQDSSNKFNEIYGAKVNDFTIRAVTRRMEEANRELKEICDEKC